MNIKKIGIGIILLLGIYFGYQQYKNQQNIEVDFVENLENVKICSDADCDADDAECSDSTTCCSGNCNAGLCEPCYKLGGPCSCDGDCCASNCSEGTCGGTTGEELVLLIEALNDLEEEFVEYLKANPEAEETLEAAEDDAAEAVSDVTPESGEVVFGLEDATGMGEVADIAVDAAVVSAAAE